MNEIIEIMNSDIHGIVSGTLLIVLLILVIVQSIQLKKLKTRYTNFIKKMSKGNNFEEALRTYIEKVEDVSDRNEEIIKYCKRLDSELEMCIKKVGIYRYNAFKDTGSDLSFTLALLNENNDGIVLNGIYSREMSNIYAKPIKNGESVYKISDEEKEAIRRAIDSENLRIKE